MLAPQTQIINTNTCVIGYSATDKIEQYYDSTYDLESLVGV